MTEQELNAGPGATAIQVAGNNVTISVDATGLVLERRHKLNARRAVTDLQLLLTELREIDLVGPPWQSVRRASSGIRLTDAENRG